MAPPIRSPKSVAEQLYRQVPQRREPESRSAIVAATDSSMTELARSTPAQFHARLVKLLEFHKMDPAEELIKMVAEQSQNGAGYRLDPGLRSKILLELCQYLMPKLKAVEVTGAVEHNHTINIVRYGDDGMVRRESVKKQDSVEAIVMEEVRDA